MHCITQYCVHIWIPDRIYIKLTLFKEYITLIIHVLSIDLTVPNRQG